MHKAKDLQLIVLFWTGMLIFSVYLCGRLVIMQCSQKAIYIALQDGINIHILSWNLAHDHTYSPPVCIGV